ncbi:hypothetical protein J2X67_005391 [Variovorax sp. 3319]|nr:hypothetical protein [Variovorax sp. 3319]
MRRRPRLSRCTPIRRWQAVPAAKLQARRIARPGPLQRSRALTLNPAAGATIQTVPGPNNPSAGPPHGPMPLSFLMRLQHEALLVRVAEPKDIPGGEVETGWQALAVDLCVHLTHTSSTASTARWDGRRCCARPARGGRRGAPSEKELPAGLRSVRAPAEGAHSLRRRARRLPREAAQPKQRECKQRWWSCRQCRPRAAVAVAAKAMASHLQPDWAATDADGGFLRAIERPVAKRVCRTLDGRDATVGHGP